jgi:hypothetical protein
MKKEYNIPLELFEKGFIAFQKRSVYPKNALMTVVCVAMSGMITYTNLKLDQSSTTNFINWLLVFVLLSVCLNSWFSALKVRKNLMKSLDGLQNDKYRFEIDEKEIVISTVLEESSTPVDDTPEEEKGNFDIYDGVETPEKIESTHLDLKNRYFRFYEYPGFFLVYQIKMMIYVVPKGVFETSEIEKIKGYIKGNNVKGSWM